MKWGDEISNSRPSFPPFTATRSLMWCRRTARPRRCGSGWRRSSRRFCPAWTCWTSPGSPTAWGKGDLLPWRPGTSLRFVHVTRHADTCRLYRDEGLALDGTPNQTRSRKKEWRAPALFQATPLHAYLRVALPASVMSSQWQEAPTETFNPLCLCS